MCSRAVTVIRRALNPRALQTAAGHPNDDKMLQKTAFHKVYNAKYCVSLYSFRKAGDTLERERDGEKERGKERGDKGRERGSRRKRAKAPVISQITSLDALTCLET